MVIFSMLNVILLCLDMLCPVILNVVMIVECNYAVVMLIVNMFCLILLSIMLLP
jgi:hypothetical protein